MSLRFTIQTHSRLLPRLSCAPTAPLRPYFYLLPRSSYSDHSYHSLLRRRSFSRAANFRPNQTSVTGPSRLESSVSLTTAGTGVIVAAALLGFLVWQGYARESSPDSTSDPLDSNSVFLFSSQDQPTIRVYPGMTAEVGPGRPGNLTAEQEAKLKELWELLHQLINPPSRRDSTVETNGATQSPLPSNLGLEESPSDASKKKKRFGSLLGRKKEKDGGNDSDSQSMYSVSSTAPAGEDKHGQNKEFREALQKMSSTELREALWTFSKADDPDANLCRYLRARKWNVQNALVMLISTIHWRRNIMKLDEDIMKHGEESAFEASKGNPDAGTDPTVGKDFMKQQYMGKSFLHGTDKDGRPMCFIRVRLHRGGDQSVEALERYTVLTIETARFMLRPPVDTAVIVFDMTGFTIANMDYTPVKFMIKVFEANYPESLGYVFVHRAPWIFQGFWKLIRGWLDPVVASKIHFTSDANELSKFVDMDRIPKELGGQEDWEYKYVDPIPGENAPMKDTDTCAKLEDERWKLIEEYERLTEAWVSGDPSSSADELKKQRLAIAQKLRDNYWQLDPYIRARSLYDRLGLIKPGGWVDMYPESRHGARSISDDVDDGASVYYDAQSEWS